MDKLRQDLRIVRQVLEAEVSYVVCDPASQKYFRFRPLEYAVLEKLDGTRGHEQIAVLVRQQRDAHLSAAAVERFVAELKKLNLIVQTVGEKSIALLERLRHERILKATRSGSLLYMRFPAVNPDAAYNRLIGPLRFFWSRAFVLLSLALFAVAAAILITDWRAVQAGLTGLYSRGGWDLALIYFVLFTIIVAHENAHGLTCKHYGGEVRELGFMFIYFLPAFYANVTAAAAFPGKAAKLWVTAAGSFAELVICSLATLVWYFSTPGEFLHHLAFLFILVSAISSIPINMNPLIKLDGYFALADLLGIPNLNDRAWKYTGALARKHIFRLPAEIPVHSARTRRILLAYGISAFFYRVVFLCIVLYFFHGKLTQWFPLAGTPILAGLAFLVLRRRLQSAGAGIRYFWLDKKERWMKPKLLVPASVGAAMLGAFLLLPLPYSLVASFVIDGPEQVPVRTPVDGFVERVTAEEGSRLRRGDTLAVLRNPDLEKQAAGLRLELQGLDQAAQASLGVGNLAERLTSARRREQSAVLLADTESRLAALRLLAPADGVVVTPRLADRHGVHLAAGAIFCQMVPAGPWIARSHLDETELEEVTLGAVASLRPNRDGAELTGRLARLAPASQLHQRLSASEHPRYVAHGGTSFAAPITAYEAVIEIQSAGDNLKPGMSGLVKIHGPKRSLSYSVWRAARNSFRSRIWW